MLQGRGSHAANMERWVVYMVMLQIFAAVARAVEDFRHISYEGENWKYYTQMRDKNYISSSICYNIGGFVYCEKLLFVIFELYF